MSVFKFWHISSWSGSLLCLLIFSCTSGAPSDAAPPKAIPVSIVSDSLVYSIPYDLSHPADTFLLPYELVEVSGLSYLAPNQLLLVQDEKGSLYVYEEEKEEISREYRFGKSGDYEGVELVGDMVYVLKSNGKIEEVSGFLEGETGETKEYNNQLNSDHDTEGLGYDPQSGQLLIACKEPYMANGREVRNQRAIYGYNLQTHQLSERPVITINLAEIQAFLQAYGPKETWATDFHPGKKSSCKPSGIAIHPLSGHTYVIASVGKLLLVLNSSHQVIAVHPLPRAQFSQPEGICFSPEGTLYISNEGKDGRGYISKFDMIASNTNN
ncbi:MAG: hypothetical protein AAF587_01680 [Bacteroidota bacterium]